jgi:hypothetical protein
MRKKNAARASEGSNDDMIFDVTGQPYDGQSGFTSYPNTHVKVPATVKKGLGGKITSMTCFVCYPIPVVIDSNFGAIKGHLTGTGHCKSLALNEKLAIIDELRDSIK